MILFAVTTSLSKSNYGGNDWVDGMPLAPVLLALLYNPIVLFLTIFQRRGRPIHPGWHVGVDLFIWGLALPAIVFSIGDGWFWYWQPVILDFDGFVPCDDWNYWTYQCNPLIYTLGKMEIAANVFLALILIIHFILFVFACIATHKWRKAQKQSANGRHNVELQYHRSPEEHAEGQPPAYTPSTQDSIKTPAGNEENPFKDQSNPFDDGEHGADGEQLNQDEVTIISAVLDLKAKPVGSIMTPMEHVFTLSSETVLDEKTMEYILSKGFSRIPIHAPDNPKNFVGMLLVKILITYDPEDGSKVRDFALATLPETRAETSCLDIVNFFQEGKSHMVLVSEFPGEDQGALGVITLEDVIEELIGEEIIDESDVYVDVHKAIRRRNLAPKSRVPKGEVITDPNDSIADGAENLIDLGEDDKQPQHAMQRTSTADGPTPRLNGAQSEQHNLLRRSSSNAYGSDREGAQKKMSRSALPDHLKHLGPSNLASRPRQTRYNTVKIKPGGGSFSDATSRSQENSSETPRSHSLAAQGGLGAAPVSAGKDAKDGVLALQAEYGTINADPAPSPKNSRKGGLVTLAENGAERPGSSEDKRPKSKRANSEDTIGSMHDGTRSPVRKRGAARSGSITENIVDMGGIKKTVLETTSSSEDHEDGGAHIQSDGPSETKDDEGKENSKPGEAGGRKKRRRKKRTGGSKGGEGEDTPLLGGDRK
ncbi:metal transporter CNNM, partial [Lecanoromycetidae sp. Uapishka_2]